MRSECKYDGCVDDNSWLGEGVPDPEITFVLIRERSHEFLSNQEI